MRIIPIALAVFTLIVALSGGLVRAGASIPVVSSAIIYHGPLMVSVFFGTLIGIERAVALELRWPWLSPALSLISGACLLHLSPAYHPLAFAAAVIFSAGALAGYRRAPQLPLLIMAVGSLFWPLGNLFAYQISIPAAVPSWVAFLTITIAGERLEFSKLRRSSRLERGLFFLALGLLSSASFIPPAFPSLGRMLLGTGLTLTGGWLLCFDIARFTLKRGSAATYISATLLLGYAWLTLSGPLVLAEPLSALGYDAWLHAFFVGFVFSMVFGHGPVIFPALLRRPFAHSAALFAPVALLTLSLATRIGGDLLSSPSVRLLGAWGNAAAVVGFFLTILYCLARGRSAMKLAYTGLQ